MDCLTVDHLKKCLDYDPGTGVFTRRETRSFHPQAKVGARAGHRVGVGYRYVRVGKHRYSEHRLAWFYVHGIWPKGEIDHVNGKKDDNRIANLREATRSQNGANTSVPKHNSSGVKGVHFDKANGRWMAHMHVNGRMKNLGRFDTFEEAVSVRTAAFKSAFGEFARA